MEDNLSSARAVYKAQGQLLSISDLLYSFIDPDMSINGMSRISDMHLKIGEAIRYRFDGVLESIQEGAPLEKEVFKELVYPLMSEEHIKQFEADDLCDLDIGFRWEKHNQSLRLNVFHDSSGPAAVIRMLPQNIPDIEDLGFPSTQVANHILSLEQGLVLITGITGSGKTTTIASILQAINERRQARVITIEDPIEYVFKSKASLISQRQLGSHVKSFHSGLHSALREDPDIIFVGEIRDRETATMAMSAAETGHLVFSTLHTRDVRGAISRMVDLFPPERSREVGTQLSFALSYVIGQKLVMRADSKGRCVAMEIMRNGGAISHMIRQGNLHQITSAIETQKKNGMNTLEQRLMEMMDEGLITKDEALRNANDTSIIERSG